MSHFATGSCGLSWPTPTRTFGITASSSEEGLRLAFRFQAMRNFGLRLTDRRANIVLVRSRDPNRPWLGLRIYRAVLAGVGVRTIQISCLQDPEEVLPVLRKARPHIIAGFSGTVARIAQAMGDADKTAIAPRLVAVGGEVLTPLMRHQIREAFGALVFEIYASHEFSLIGWECKETGELHTHTTLGDCAHLHR